MKPESRRKILITGGVAAVLLALGLGGLAFLIVGHRVPDDPDLLYQKAVESMGYGNYDRAIKYLTRADTLRPGDPEILFQAAKANHVIGRSNEVRRLAISAWDAGRHAPEVIVMIAATYGPANRAEGLEEVLTRLESLPENTDRTRLRGDILAAFEEPEGAVEAWVEALDAEPDAALASRAARTLMRTGDAPRAEALLEKHLEAGAIGAEGIGYLAAARVGKNDYQGALDLFEHARKEGLYDAALRYDHGLLFTLMERYPEVLNVLDQEVASPGPDPGAKETSPAALVASRTRLLRAFVLTATGDAGALEAAAARPPGDAGGKRAEGEQLFLQVLRDLLARNAPPLATVKKAQRLLPGEPVVELVAAREFVRAGEPDAAVAACLNVRGAVARWPILRFELARALHLAGKDREALQVLAELHGRKMYSKQSVQLFREVSRQLGLSEVSQASQDFLEKLFPEDLDVQLYAGSDALLKGDVQRAREIFEQVLADHPDDVRARLGQLRLRLASGDTEGLLEAVEESSLDPGLTAPFVAVANLLLDRPEEAEKAFALALETGEENVALRREYAHLLARLGRAEEAAESYRKVLATDPADAAAHYGLTYLALGAGDWAGAEAAAKNMLTSGAELGAAHQTLVAFVELQAGRSGTALERCQLALTQDPDALGTRLLLGRLLQMRGDERGAARAYEETLARSPEATQAKAQLALVRLRMEDFAAARALADELVAAQPERPDIKLLQFRVAAVSGESERAATLLEALKASLKPAAHAYYRSWLAGLEGRDAEALEYLRDHLDTPSVAVRWAALKLSAGEGEAALETLAKVRPSVRDLVALTALAEEKNLDPTALALCETVLERAPKDPVANNNWAWHALDEPGVDKARVLAAARLAHEAMPDEPNVLNTYAEALLLNGLHQECKQLLGARTAVTLKQPHLLFPLAEAHEGLGEYRSALRAYLRCRDLHEQGEAWLLRVPPETLPERIARVEAAIARQAAEAAEEEQEKEEP